jgi:hypothetical protein
MTLTCGRLCKDKRAIVVLVLLIVQELLVLLLLGLAPLARSFWAFLLLFLLSTTLLQQLCELGVLGLLQIDEMLEQLYNASKINRLLAQ